MTETAARNLSNSFLAVRLLALHEFPASADLGAGPYLVIQRGVDPSDAAMEPGDFLLTREGAWMPVGAFLGRPTPERRDQVCFPAAADVIELLGRLPARPRVLTLPPASPAGEPAPGGALEADMDAALRRALRLGCEAADS